MVTKLTTVKPALGPGSHWWRLPWVALQSLDPRGCAATFSQLPHPHQRKNHRDIKVNIPQLGHPERVVSFFLESAHISYQSLNSSVNTQVTHISENVRWVLLKKTLIIASTSFKPASKTTFCKYISSNDFNCQSTPDCLHRPEGTLMKFFQH